MRKKTMFRSKRVIIKSKKHIRIFSVLHIFVLILLIICTILFNLKFYFNFNLIDGFLGYFSLIGLSICFILSGDLKI